MDDRTEESAGCVDIIAEDVEAALRDVGAYIDISPADAQSLCVSAARHARRRLLQSRPAAEIMTREVITIRREDNIDEASRLLSENGISGLPVVDDENRVVGVITEKDVLAMAGIERGHSVRDLLRHLLGEPLARRHEGEKVEDFMSSPPITVRPDTDIREAVSVMNGKGIKRLIVTDSENRLVGIIARADLLKAVHPG